MSDTPTVAFGIALRIVIAGLAAISGVVAAHGRKHGIVAGATAHQEVAMSDSYYRAPYELHVHRGRFLVMDDRGHVLIDQSAGNDTVATEQRAIYQRIVAGLNRDAESQKPLAEASLRAEATP